VYLLTNYSFQDCQSKFFANLDKSKVYGSPLVQNLAVRHMLKTDMREPKNAIKAIAGVARQGNSVKAQYHMGGRWI
jgi:hypothetical protein